MDRKRDISAQSASLLANQPFQPLHKTTSSFSVSLSFYQPPTLLQFLLFSAFYLLRSLINPCCHDNNVKTAPQISFFFLFLPFLGQSGSKSLLKISTLFFLKNSFKNVECRSRFWFISEGVIFPAQFPNKSTSPLSCISPQLCYNSAFFVPHF